MLLSSPGELYPRHGPRALRGSTSPTQIVAAFLQANRLPQGPPDKSDGEAGQPQVQGNNGSSIASGRIVVYGDSNCIDMRPPPVGQGCNILNEAFLDYLVSGDLPKLKNSQGEVGPRSAYWTQIRTLNVAYKGKGYIAGIWGLSNGNADESKRRDRERHIDFLRYGRDCINMHTLIAYVQIFEGDGCGDRTSKANAYDLRKGVLALSADYMIIVNDRIDLTG